MSHLSIRAQLFASLVAVALAGCASAPPRVASTVPLVQVRAAELGVQEIGSVAPDKAKPVYIEFQASPTMTAELRHQLARDGFQLAADRTQAAVVYDVDGVFRARRAATGRTAAVRAGDFAEKPVLPATRTGNAFSIGLGPTAPLTLINTLGMNFGDRTGLRDAFNTATAGDPDGVCLSRCETWNYQQRVDVTARRAEGGATQGSVVTVTYEAPKLEPGLLFTQAYEQVGRLLDIPLRPKP